MVLHMLHHLPIDKTKSYIDILKKYHDSPNITTQMPDNGVWVL